MAHGLNKFKAQDLIDKAQSAIDLLEQELKNSSGDGAEAGFEATHEVLRVVLENQMQIAETLDLIKTEFDKFEEGLGKIL